MAPTTPSSCKGRNLEFSEHQRRADLQSARLLSSFWMNWIIVEPKMCNKRDFRVNWLGDRIA